MMQILLQVLTEFLFVCKPDSVIYFEIMYLVGILAALGVPAFAIATTFVGHLVQSEG